MEREILIYHIYKKAVEDQLNSAYEQSRSREFGITPNRYYRLEQMVKKAISNQDINDLVNVYQRLIRASLFETISEWNKGCIRQKGWFSEVDGDFMSFKPPTRPGPRNIKQFIALLEEHDQLKYYIT